MVYKLEINIENKNFVNTCEVCKYIFSKPENIKLLTPFIMDYYEKIGI